MGLPLTVEKREHVAAQAANDTIGHGEQISQIETLRANIEMLSAKLSLLALNTQLETVDSASLGAMLPTLPNMMGRLREVSSLIQESSLSGEIIREAEDLDGLLIEQQARMAEVPWSQLGGRFQNA